MGPTSSTRKECMVTVVSKRQFGRRKTRLPENPKRVSSTKWGILTLALALLSQQTEATDAKLVVFYQGCTAGLVDNLSMCKSWNGGKNCGVNVRPTVRSDVWTFARPPKMGIRVFRKMFAKAFEHTVNISDIKNETILCYDKDEMAKYTKPDKNQSIQWNKFQTQVSANQMYVSFSTERGMTFELIGLDQNHDFIILMKKRKLESVTLQDIDHQPAQGSGADENRHGSEQKPANVADPQHPGPGVLPAASAGRVAQSSQQLIEPTQDSTITLLQPPEEPTEATPEGAPPATEVAGAALQSDASTIRPLAPLVMIPRATNQAETSARSEVGNSCTSGGHSGIPQTSYPRRAVESRVGSKC